MSKTRTTVLLDDDLLKKAKHFTASGSTTDVITRALTEMVQRETYEALAKVLGTEEGEPPEMPRRRPPDFLNEGAEERAHKKEPK
jgi:hypothetical protein